MNAGVVVVEVSQADTDPSEYVELELPQSLDSAIRIISHELPVGAGAAEPSPVSGDRQNVVTPKSHGYGAAVAQGLRSALDQGAELIVLCDRGVRCDSATLGRLVARVAEGRCDVAKASRLDAEGHSRAGLAHALEAFALKLSSGYWHLADAAPGCWVFDRYTAQSLVAIGFNRRSFGLTDVLLQLYLLRATIQEVTPVSRISSRRSRLSDALLHTVGHGLNFLQRIWQFYFVRHLQPLSLAWIIGPLLTIYGVRFGLTTWQISLMTGLHATAGQVMNAALPTLIGVSLSIAVLSVDRSNTPPG